MSCGPEGDSLPRGYAMHCAAYLLDMLNLRELLCINWRTGGVRHGVFCMVGLMIPVSSSVYKIRVHVSFYHHGFSIPALCVPRTTWHPY